MGKLQDKINEYCIKAKCKAVCAAYNFLSDESGDTNFISIALVIVIVVILAGIVLTASKGAINTVMQKLTDWINSAS